MITALKTLPVKPIKAPTDARSLMTGGFPDADKATVGGNLANQAKSNPSF